MPAEAVALDLNVGDIEKDDIAKAREIMIEFGFHAHPYDDGPIGGIINYQPFGHTDDNIELVEECVQRLSDAFPDAEVSYEIRKNRDAGLVVGKRCYIQIEVRSSDGATDEQKVTTDYRTDNSEEASDGDSRVTNLVEDGESGDGPEWRAFDSESEETETVESTEVESDERDTRVGDMCETMWRFRVAGYSGYVPGENKESAHAAVLEFGEDIGEDLSDEDVTLFKADE